jgi:hypothetical protein
MDHLSCYTDIGRVRSKILTRFWSILSWKIQGKFSNNDISRIFDELLIKWGIDIWEKEILSRNRFMRSFNTLMWGSKRFEKDAEMLP